MIGSVKISFRLPLSVDGFPPVGVESLWAKRVGGAFEIDSIPFFTRDATVGDIVRAAPDANGNLWFEEVELRSAHSLVRVVFFDLASVPSVTEKLNAIGCATEGFSQFKLLAVDVPADVEFSDLQQYLQSEAAAGHLDYEEALLRH
jgi:hypothetical protein